MSVAYFMDHAAHAATAAAVASGTLIGHWAPAVLFFVWGLWWAAELLSGRRSREGHGPVETTALIPMGKILALPIGVWFELPNSGWYPMDQVMGWSHITIYLGFALSGVVDLLHRRGRVGESATYAGVAAATLTAAFLLALHGSHAGVEDVGHRLLALSYAVSGVAALWEAARPHPGVRWVRVGAMLVVGAWWGVVGCVLFRSGWTLDDPVRVLWMYPLYVWTALGVGSALLGGAVVAKWVRGRPQ